MNYQRKLKYKPRRSKLTSVELVEGETIEQKCRRLVQNGEPIKDGAPEIFTERKEGVQAGYNIRTDRWEVATDAMDKVTKSRLAKREGVIKLNPDDGDTKKEGDSGAKKESKA